MTFVIENTDAAHYSFADFLVDGREVRYLLAPLERKIVTEGIFIASSPRTTVEASED